MKYKDVQGTILLLLELSMCIVSLTDIIKESILETQARLGPSMVKQFGWELEYRWVVMNMSVIASFVILLIHSCSSSCRHGRSLVRSKWSEGTANGYLKVLSVFSLLFAVLWTVIVANDHKPFVPTLENTVTYTYNNGTLIYLPPFGKGVRWSADCSAMPFTQMVGGSSTCEELRKRPILAFLCLGVWILIFIAAVPVFSALKFLSCLAIGKTASKDNKNMSMDTLNANVVTTVGGEAVLNGSSGNSISESTWDEESSVVTEVG